MSHFKASNLVIALDAMNKGHQDALALIDANRNQVSDERVKTFLTQIEPVIQEHAHHIEMLKQ